MSHSTFFFNSFEFLNSFAVNKREIMKQLGTDFRMLCIVTEFFQLLISNDFKTHPFSVKRKNRFYHHIHSTWFFFRWRLEKKNWIKTSSTHFFPRSLSLSRFFLLGKELSLNFFVIPMHKLLIRTNFFFHPTLLNPPRKVFCQHKNVLSCK